jgi:hypothetical protein
MESGPNGNIELLRQKNQALLVQNQFLAYEIEKRMRLMMDWFPVGAPQRDQLEAWIKEIRELGEVTRKGKDAPEEVDAARCKACLESCTQESCQLTNGPVKGGP